MSSSPSTSGSSSSFYLLPLLTSAPLPTPHAAGLLPRRASSSPCWESPSGAWPCAVRRCRTLVRARAATPSSGLAGAADSPGLTWGRRRCAAAVPFARRSSGPSRRTPVRASRAARAPLHPHRPELHGAAPPSSRRHPRSNLPRSHWICNVELE